MEKIGAVILAGGKGTRMKSDVHKQFLLWKDKPLFMYSVEKYLSHVQKVILVTGKEDMDLMNSYLEKYGISDQVTLVEGGKERFHSSMNGIRALKKSGDFQYVMIHDAARPFVSSEVILDSISEVKKHGAVISAVQSKDTIKRVDENGMVIETPDRASLFIVQTPQSFEMNLILDAYEKMEKSEKAGISITDDAMVVETFTDHPVYLSKGDYQNVKVTTPEDLTLLRD